MSNKKMNQFTIIDIIERKIQFNNVEISNEDDSEKTSGYNNAIV